VYDFCKKIDGSPADCGTWLLDAVKVFIQQGQCLEQMLPYDPNLPCNHNDTITSAILQNAATFKSSPTYYSNPKDVSAMKSSIALHNSDVGFCIPVYNSWYLSPTVDRTGQITMPLSGDQLAGGHCMCMVGYQDNSGFPGGGYFIIRNSWGLGWGAQNPYGAGYGTIPYAYISGYGNEAASY
jgi:C1A family cysteine protease